MRSIHFIKQVLMWYQISLINIYMKIFNKILANIIQQYREIIHYGKMELILKAGSVFKN